jgi:integrase
MRDRHGRWRHYLRRKGFRRMALSGLYGTEEFAESYRLAMGGSIAVAPREIGGGRTQPGSVNHLIVSYLKSSQWAALSTNTRRTRKPILEQLRGGRWGNVMVRDLHVRHVRRILDDQQQPHAKHHWLKALRGVFSFAVEELKQIDDNPSAGIKLVRPQSDGYWTWLDSQIEQFRRHWPLGTVPRLVMEFALETASRRGEIIHLGKQHVRNGRIVIKRAKGSRSVDIPLTNALRAAIEAMPDTGQLTYLVNASGQPYSPNWLGTNFARWAQAAGLPACCRLHGLRKSRTAQLAERGATAHQIMGVTGHKSLSEVQRYADKYDRRQAADAAMALLDDGDQNQNAECKTA